MLKTQKSLNKLPLAKKLRKFDSELTAKQNTLSFCNLIFFLGSFLLMSYIGFSNSSNNPSSFHAEHKISAHTNNNCNSTELLIEENENETENNFQLQSFVLPFFISFFQYEALPSVLISAQPLAEKLSNPIYISICNFRI